MSQCLSLDPLSFSVWRQLYTKHLAQSRSVQTGSKRSQCSPTEPVGCLNSFWELLTKPHVLLPPSLLLNHLLESWESSSKKVGVRCGTRAVVGWDSVPVLL